MKRKRKRFFSLILVPDQDQDPKSISMSYTKGHFLISVLVVFIIHSVLGGLGYYRLIKLNSLKNDLQTENEELKIRNKKIEQIAREFQEIRNTDEKIRRAFGGSLGLSSQSIEDIRSLEVKQPPKKTPKQALDISLFGEQSPVNKIHNRLYLLTESESDFLDPQYLPTLLPVSGYLTTHFQRGGWFIGRKHYGIDIAEEKGTPIRAAGSGIVLVANWTPDFGNVVVISHGNGLYSYYGHAMRLLVIRGVHVKKGQTIALLGSSGITSSAPHLHFEIWKDGEPLDPEKYLYALRHQNSGNGP